MIAHISNWCGAMNERCTFVVHLTQCHYSDIEQWLDEQEITFSYYHYSNYKDNTDILTWAFIEFVDNNAEIIFLNADFATACKLRFADKLNLNDI